MMNHTSLLLEELGVGPMWVRRHLTAHTPAENIAQDALVPVQQAAPAAPVVPPTKAPIVMRGPSAFDEDDGVAATPVAVAPRAPVRLAPTADTGFDPAPPAWFDEVEGAVSMAPMEMPPFEDEDGDAHVVSKPNVAIMDWASLAGTVSGCQQCQLCNQRKNTVFGVGDKRAKWLFVGEGPGRNEDEQGVPFVGPAGQLLDNMLGAMGMKRDDNVYIANVIKCRPTTELGKDRRPSQEEVAACLPYLQRQIAMIQPTVIVALGHTAAWALLGIDPAVPLVKLRGQVHRYQTTPVVVTYHPSYLLRQPKEKGQAWQDLCLAMSANRDVAQ